MKVQKQIFILIFLFSILLFIQCANTSRKQTNVLVLTNSNSPEYCKAQTYLFPYLNHFGLPYQSIDLKFKALPQKLDQYALIIIAHKQITQGLKKFSKANIFNAIHKGTGLVSFDFHFTLQDKYQPVAYSKTNELKFSADRHFITQFHQNHKRLALFGEMNLPELTIKSGEVLIKANSTPLLIVQNKGKGNIAVWTSLDWMSTFVLGPLGGLDDCFWRSMVWAARKPFAIRGLPPIVTMRVDDVAGQGQKWGKSPLYWVKTANQFDFKPFLALFIYNLTPKAIEELRGYLLSNQATASPHAFGRPSRSKQPNFDSDYFTENVDANFYKGYYYYPKAIPVKSKYYDEFIYFDWHHQIAWPDTEATRRLQAVEAWYQDHQPLPMSAYIVPHWYEIGSNVIPYLMNHWKIEFLGIAMPPDLYYSAYVPWLRAGPFRLYEEPGACAFEKKLRAQRPVFYADFINISGYKIFISLTEIRDNAGYEWAPNNNVQASIQRGITQISRALNSMALAVLFTHETDFISKIKPDNWYLILKGIHEGITPYKPVFMNMDDALRYLRATKTAKFESFIYDNQKHNIRATFSGYSDVLTHFYLFYEKNGTIQRKLLEIPPFKNSLILEKQINQ